jgi:hypothetical protein
MSAIASSLRQFAVHEADELKAAEARIEHEIQDIEGIIAVLNGRRESARLGQQRLLDYNPGPGPDYLCPRCWGHDGARSDLARNEGGFRCPVCGFKIGSAGA